MLVAELVERLDATVPSLARRVEGAAELAELVRRKALPQASPFAFVLPTGLVARAEGDSGTGVFTQMVDEVFAVVLFVRASGDITGGKALPAIDALVWAVIGAVCGWGPDEAIGVFQLRRGQLLSAEAGAVIYQLDFALQQQVRIIA
ncbi:hypothetical protein ASD44_09635 [Mesorhizobium sp. Root554]|uniref:phage tail terminator protein n=1 Tax=unclassified Mesorhizobium TaxID=325217 RepID=UPI0006FC5E4C|nr:MULTISPECIES: hypothetical protein [unclassified Mesorhizobium]KQZ14304.1 hypothetical protein ASD27_09645 [Mesorhizobium sp. Root1471]KQZ36815.1 hypothetical protein ASD44_09635 [Mesorhizobium sp. Root554]